MLRARLHAALIAPLCAASLATASPAPPARTDAARESADSSARESSDRPTRGASDTARGSSDTARESSDTARGSSDTARESSDTSPTREGPDVPADRPSPRLAIVRPRTIGFENPALADQIAAQLHSGLQRGRVRVLDLAAVARASGEPCDDGCLRRLRTNLGADFVLRATVTLVDRDHVVRLELVDNHTRAAVAHREATCELCGLGELRRFVADQVSRLVGVVDDVVHPPPRLHLESVPAGALVYLDGRLSGTTPFDEPVPEGAHVVRLTHEGHITEELPLTSSRGVDKRMHVNLRRTPEMAKARRGGFALLFTGLAAAMAGVTLLGLDGQPVRSRCSGADVDLAGHCRYRYDTDWGGATLLAASAALAAGGVFLLVPASGQRRLRLRAGLGGAGLMFRGSF
jgi:hypothetical protein